jgi:hypothetical protein
VLRERKKKMDFSPAHVELCYDGDLTDWMRAQRGLDWASAWLGLAAAPLRWTAGYRTTVLGAIVAGMLSAGPGLGEPRGGWALATPIACRRGRG